MDRNKYANYTPRRTVVSRRHSPAEPSIVAEVEVASSRRNWGRFRWSRKAVIAFAGLVLLIGGGATYAQFGPAIGQSSTTGVNLQKGLVGWWKLDGNFNDSTVYRHNGVASGSPTATTDREGKTNAAYNFNGSGQYVSLASGTMPNGSYTKTAWIDLNAYATSGNILSGSGGTCSNGNTGTSAGHALYTPNGYLSAGHCGNWTAARDPNILSLNTWYFVAVTYDPTVGSGTIKLYKNASLVASATGTTTETSTVAQIAAYASGSLLNGKIDDVRIYNRVLNQNEITALYKEYNPALKASSGESGLVGWWKLDGNANDATPYRNNGTIVGAVAAADRKNVPGTALSFNGSSSYMTVPDATNYNFGTGAFTESAFFKVNSITSGTQQIFCKRNGTNTLEVQINSSGKLVVYAGYSSNAFTSLATITPGMWYHFALTRSGSTVSLYVNGALDSTATSANSVSSPGSLFNIGRDGNGSGEYFGGSIDDVRIYSRALSATEIAAQAANYNSQININSYSSQVNLSSGLIGYWPLNGNANDLTPYRDNGTVTNAVLTTDRRGRANSAYQLTDNVSYINMASSPILNNTKPFTYSIWLYRTVNSIYHWPMIMGAANSHSYYAIRSQNYGDNITFEYATSPYAGSTYTNTGGFSLPINSWHMYTFTYDGSVIKGYKDGVLSSTATGVTLNPSSGGVNLGAYTSTANSSFNGVVDDARIYNRPLSASEVAALYNEYR